MDHEAEYLLSRGWTLNGGEWLDQQGIPWGVSTEQAYRIQKEKDEFRFSIGYHGDDQS